MQVGLPSKSETLGWNLYHHYPKNVFFYISKYVVLFIFVFYLRQSLAMYPRLALDSGVLGLQCPTDNVVKRCDLILT
jgi:hypothetical protein